MRDSDQGNGGAADTGVRLRMRSEERRIASQHERLDELCREVYAQIDKNGARQAINDYLLFAAALDAHMTVEEDIYFPALHGLRPDAGDELAALVAEHHALRADVDEVKTLLSGGHSADARIKLDGLARRVSEHEGSEEALIARLTHGPVTDYGGSDLG